MKIIPLSEGAFTVDQSKKFIPFDKKNDDLQKRAKGSLLVEIQPFAIITSKDILLLDTGLGFADGQLKMQIHKNLADHGISATDITKVLISHLHKDHAGGLASPNKKEPAFANADYYINKEEWGNVLNTENASYENENYSFLADSPKLHLTDEKGVIDGYIFYEKSGGHSAHHQVYRIVEAGEIIFYGGDEAPQLQQMRNKFRAKYDYDGARAMALRNDWWQTGEKEKWRFLFYHDINTPVYQF